MRAARHGDRLGRAQDTCLPRRYRVLRRIPAAVGGSRGGSRAYVVEDSLGGKAPVALERIDLSGNGSSPMAEASRVEAFRREMGILAGLHHPSLPAVLDFGLLEDRPRRGIRGFFTREHVEGPDILDWSAGKEGDALEPIARQVLDLLDHIHSKGILHRVIRPAAIIIEEQPMGPRAKLVGFGAARLPLDVHARGAAPALPYLSPEVLRGERPGPGSDLFGLGVTLFECLYRALPYGGRTAAEIAEDQARRLPSPPRGWSGRGWRVESIIWRLLARDPARRSPGGAPRGGRSSTASFAGSDRPVGMESALGSILAAVEASRSGAPRPGFILIEGDAGSGKTRLLSEVVDRARMEGCPCIAIAGASSWGESSQPDGLLMRAALEAVDPGTCRETGGRPGPMNDFGGAPAIPLPADDPLLRDRCLAGDAALWDVLADASRREPVVIVLDDLCDAPRALVERLSRLARRAGAPEGGAPGARARTLICAAARTGARLPASIEDLAAGDLCLRLRLEPLTRTQVRTLLLRSFGPSPVLAPAAAVLHGATGGSPGFLIEAVKHLLAHGSIVFRPGRPLAAADPPESWSLPPSVEDLLDRRWAELSADEARLAANLSASRAPLSLTAARAASPFPLERTVYLLQALTAKDVLAARGGRGSKRALAFAHPRLAWHAEAALGSEEYSGVSSRLARARRREGAGAEELAFLHAGAGEDGEAIRLGLASLREIERSGGLRETSRLARLLLSLLRLDDRRRAPVFLALTRALSASGEHSGAAHALEVELSRVEEGRTRAGLLALLAAERLSAGDRSGARPIAAEACRLAAKDRRAWLEEIRAMLVLCRLDAEEGRLANALEFARAAAARLSVVRAGRARRLAESAVLSRIGSLAWATGDLPGAMESYRRGLSLLEGQPDSAEKAALALNLANAASAAGQGNEALRGYSRAAKLAGDAGARDIETLAHSNLSIHHLHRWELDRAEEALDAASRGSEALGTPKFRRFARLSRGALLVRKGKIEEAKALLEAERTAAISEGDAQLAIGLGFQVLKCRMEAGDLGGAIRLGVSLRREAVASGRDRAVAESSLMLGVAWLHAGDARRALRHLERASGAAARSQPHVEAEAFFHQALARLQEGDRASAERLLRSAGRAFASVGARLRRAECLEERAALLLEMGRKGEARSAERLARKTLDSSPRGSLPLLLWAQALLARARGVLARRTPPECAPVVELARDLSEVLAHLRLEGARRLEWRVLLRLSEAHRVLGNEDFAQKLLEDARSALDSLRAGLPQRLADLLGATQEARAVLEGDAGRASTRGRPGPGADPREVERLKESCRLLEAENRRLRSEKEELERTRAPGRIDVGVAADSRGGAGARHDLVGSSPAMERVFRLIDAAARSDLPVVIWGETGTGKDLVARAIHLASARSGGPFVSESVGALPEALLESELFGHVEGAFTGAGAARPGRFALAQGGSLCLSGVEEIGPEVQVKLLRALASREIRPVGGSEPLPVDFRLITTLSSDPREASDGGRLRPDFLYRILGIEIHVPPLRERRGDIPLLLEHFLELERERFGRKPRVDPDAMETLLRHSWPGNVRELENDVRRLAILGPAKIRASDLRAAAREPKASRAAPGAVLPGMSWAEAREAMDRAYFDDALRRCGGRLSEVAVRLGIHERSVYKLRKRFGEGRRAEPRRPVEG